MLTQNNVMFLTSTIACSEYSECQSIPIQVGRNSVMNGKIVARSKKLNLSIIELPFELKSIQVGGTEQLNNDLIHSTEPFAPRHIHLEKKAIFPDSLMEQCPNLNGMGHFPKDMTVGQFIKKMKCLANNETNPVPLKCVILELLMDLPNNVSFREAVEGGAWAHSVRNEMSEMDWDNIAALFKSSYGEEHGGNSFAVENNIVNGTMFLTIDSNGTPKLIDIINSDPTQFGWLSTDNSNPDILNTLETFLKDAGYPPSKIRAQLKNEPGVVILSNQDLHFVNSQPAFEQWFMP